MQLISIDVETTGLDPDKCSIIEFAAITLDLMQPRGFRHEYHSLIRYPNGNEELYWEPIAFDMNKTIREEIEQGDDHIPTLSEFVDDFRRWIRNDVKFTPTGKNFGSFDLQFLKRVPRWRETIKLGHRAMDPGPMYALPFDEVPPDLATCLRRAGLPPQVNHRALSDAHAVLDVIENRMRTAIHEKTGNQYVVENSFIIDSTNATNGRPMVLYRNKNYEGFVREKSEFFNKFQTLGE